jgi:hypothetical protein
VADHEEEGLTTKGAPYVVGGAIPIYGNGEATWTFSLAYMLWTEHHVFNIRSRCGGPNNPKDNLDHLASYMSHQAQNDSSLVGQRSQNLYL